ncbi:MAG: hypothetical protein HC909_00320 [Blastochloris sp.]|nr:hypothetical protein [Blastochloris sp.]
MVGLVDPGVADAFLRPAASELLPAAAQTAPVIDPDGWRRNQPLPPNWVDGNRVRYAVSFARDLDESDTGPWSVWIVLRGQYFPTLRNVPVDPSGRAKKRCVFRQIAFPDGRGGYTFGEYVFVGELADNTTTTFVDEKP